MIRIKESTVMNRLPKIVTSHSGMDARKPTFPMAALISPGNVPTLPAIPPICPATVLTMPPHISNTASISGIQ